MGNESYGLGSIQLPIVSESYGLSSIRLTIRNEPNM